ncbi:hypothetical protein MJO28_009539 [Puccinia striiformis f. sp. tritici]|uniref:Uncharacterized protein n=2 Tax=Puccinia striiformis TaxID=27350 RepID=A0A2S4W6G3_9BASI|nr:hypothetical protein MJO28_009539 [Puccinia striiformis f. sp. tritici]POW17326.1 hypothetical protein PSTT_00556 [Puccinia striiformis]
MQHDSDCLHHLILAAQGLKSLDLTELTTFQLPATFGASFDNHKLPKISVYAEANGTSPSMPYVDSKKPRQHA